MGGWHGDEVVKFLHVEQEIESAIVFCVPGTLKVKNKLRREKRWS